MIDFVYYFKNIFGLLETLASQCIDFLNSQYEFAGVITLSGWELIGSGFLVLMTAKLVKKVVPFL